MKIAVVDDEYMSRKMLVQTIREEFPDAKIQEFTDGTPAWQAIQNDQSYDFVLTDMSMITMDGPELAQKIQEKYPEIQILIYTGEAESTLRKMGMPIERCLLKPVRGSALKEKIDNISLLPPFEIKEVKEERKEPQEEIRKDGFFTRLFKTRSFYNDG